jgi:hypothetical protein
MTKKVRKQRRGFASMSPSKQRKIASKGGRAAHAQGVAHKWTGGKRGTASKAGRKGGLASRGGRGKVRKAKRKLRARMTATR